MRWKRTKKLIAVGLVALMLMGVLPLQAMAEVAAAAGTTSIQNDYIKVSVDHTSGRFSIRAVDGQPIRKKDNGAEMMFRGDDPETSFTTFRIDGTDLIFGNPYKFAVDWFSEVTPPQIVTGTDGTESLVTVWSIKGIRISQIITLLMKEDREQAGNARIMYRVENNTGATVEIGSRVLLDTSVGGNDGPAFQLGQNYGVPLTVERKLVHEPETLGYDKAVDEQAYNLHKLPPYWVMRDKLDLSNPLATNVIAYGFNNLFEGGINVVDEMIVGHWTGLAGTKWDYEPDENLDYTLDTNTYGTADTAVAYYWQPDAVRPGGSHTFELLYGLGEIIAPDKVFDVRFLDPTQKLETNEDETEYSNEGIFEINAEIENLAMFDMEHSLIDVTLKLENGLSFVDEHGQVLGDTSQKLTFRKEVPPEQAAQGVEVIPYKPGETVAAKWRVKASGRPWPTTRQYLVTVSSPETEQKLEARLEQPQGMPEAEIRAIYESSRANFIFLPPLGQLRETLVYSLSPEEAYVKDEKYITLNISNIAAYDVGNELLAKAANFDLYLRNVKSGERYKVPVSRSVTTQPLGNGFAGDMKIVYRGGEKVREDGTTLEVLTDAALPLGEYAVQVDFRDKGVPEIAEALSFTTKATFAVSDNAENRVRRAGILAVYKTRLDLNGSGAADKAAFAEALPWVYGGLDDSQFAAKRTEDRTAMAAAKQEMVAAARRLDAELPLERAIDLSATPVYAVRTFESEAQFELFASRLKSQYDQEIVLEVRGNIVQSGEGQNAQYMIRSDTEPAIINKSVAYSGKDMTLSFGRFPLDERIAAGTDTPFLQTVFAGGDGTLSIANSGFVFHKGEWTVDFYNGFNKTLGIVSKLSPEEQEWEKGRNPQDTSQNGNLLWAGGLIGDALNPYRNLLVSYVYFNRHSLFAAPSFTIDGFGLKLHDFVLRRDGVSFGGEVNLRILRGEVSNVIFNQSGFVGIDTSLGFRLTDNIGLFDPSYENGVNGGIDITHYKDPGKYGVLNSYGIQFSANLENLFSVSAELAFKRVPDGRILPDVIAFGSSLPEPGIAVGVATKISALRGAVRELAMTIAGGTERLPLTLEAGIDLEFGVKPAIFTGSVDLTLKATGMKIAGKLGFGEGTRVIPMLTEALIQTQWVSPMFIRARAQIDVGGWNIIVGSASLFIGENLEKRRVDFEGIVSARLQVPGSVPVVGGMGFGIRAGANNDKLWASISLLFVSVGIKYYWGGGISFGTNGVEGIEGMDGMELGRNALAYLVIHDPEEGPRLLEIGTGIDVLATSWEYEEHERQEIRYTAVGEGVDLIEGGSQNLGIGGIRTSDGGKTHTIPMNKATGDVLLEVEYYTTTRPALTMKRADGSDYAIVIGEATDAGANANAFEQIVKAPKEGDLKGDGTTVTRREALAATDIRRVYIAVPRDEAKTGDWTLSSSQPIKSKLMNLPVLPELAEVSLEPDGSDPDKFTARWTVEQAQAGDAVDLYLSVDRLSDAPVPGETADPGLLIAKGIEIALGDIGADGTANGELEVDVKQVAQLGGADIRGLLQQGSYYLRAELKTETAFSAKSSEQAFELIDPLAPDAVNSVQARPIGDGQFEVSFPPVVKKDGQEQAAYSYLLTATDESGETYEPFGELLYSESELEGYLSGGKYRLVVGGWNVLGKPMLDERGQVKRNADGSIAMEDGEARYAGLEPGRSYKIGVITASVPESDGRGNMRLSAPAYTGATLLPAPQKPALLLNGETVADNRYELATRSTVQSLELTADQPGVEVEVSTDDGVIGVYDLDRSGTLTLDRFGTDGVYAVQLKARNTVTGDSSVTMLYITTDTTAPMIYLDSPVTGDRVSDGAALVQGTTMNDAQLSISDADSGTLLARFRPDEDGRFEREVPINPAAAKTRLRIEAADAVGNVNSAVVEVLNDGAKLPRKLKLAVPQSVVAGGGAVPLEAYVEYTDGSRELLDNGELTYRLLMGESNASLQADGAIAGQRVGGAIVQADYAPWEGMELSATDVISVVAPADGVAPPDRMDLIRAATVGTGRGGETRVIVTASGHGGNMAGSELAYRVFSDQSQATLPAFEQDITVWSELPADGVVAAQNGQWIVIAKRTAGAPKLVTASSPAVRVYEYVATGGFTSGGSGNDGKLQVGDVVIDPARGGRDIALPFQLDGVKKSGLLVADVSAADGVAVTVRPIREALLDSVKPDQQLRLDVRGKLDRLDFQLDAGLLQLLGERGAALDLESDLGRYRLDLSAVDRESLSRLFPGKRPEQITVTLRIAVPDAAYGELADQLAQDGEIVPVGEPVAFEIIADDGKSSHEIGKLAAFVAKEIPLPEGEDERSVSTAAVLEPDGGVRHVPTKFDVRDGRIYAVAHSMTNSVYMLTRQSPAFADMRGHWADETVSDLASRLVVGGSAPGRFEPDRGITRAEFAALLAKALGLKRTEAPTLAYADVSEQDWYYEAVLTAVEYGLMGGYSDESFGPLDPTTREQAMAMLVRAAALAGLTPAVSGGEAGNPLARFADAAELSDWARNSAVQAVKLGVINGQSATTLAPQADISRAEVAAAVRRLLLKLDFVQ